LIDNHVLKNLLIGRLDESNQAHLLKENGGMHMFGHSWSQRFWKRNGFENRVATSKMRDLPADYEEKENMIRIGAKLIHDYKIPPAVVMGIDETNALWVSQKNRTMSKKGARRIRQLGKGFDKAQVNDFMLHSLE
jgi:hypothetical protein